MESRRKFFKNAVFQKFNTVFQKFILINEFTDPRRFWSGKVPLLEFCIMQYCLGGTQGNI